MTRQDYDTMAADYASNRQIHPLVLDLLVRTGRVGAESLVLEIGCGTGNYLHAMRSTGAACTGVDPSAEMLRAASVRDAEGPTLFQGTAEALPVPDAAFDLAFSVDVIHHVVDRDAAARELRRVLAPGRVGVIVTESVDDLHRRTPQVTYFPDTVAVELGRYPAIETIVAELESAGLTVDAPVSVAMPHEVTDLTPYRAKAFSSLHLIPEEAFRDGLARMARDLEQGPIPGERRYTAVIARVPRG